MARLIYGVIFLTSLFLTNCVSAAPVFFHITGHYYEFVSSDASWHQARELARERMFQGQVGYLATVSTTRENSFVTATFAISGPAGLAWIGGHEPNNDAAWVWADGPEAGERFSQSEHPVFPLFYANWGGNEPDSGAANEDYVVINLGNTYTGIGTGEWSAVSAVPSSTNPVRGYLVEYGGLPVVPEPPAVAFGMVALTMLPPRLVQTLRRKRV